MFEDISVQKAQKLIDSGTVIVIDVRTQMEWEDGHLPNALHIDIRSADFISEIEKLDKTLKYLVYCKTGGRSHVVMHLMKDVGFKDVDNVNGWLFD